ncbi:hypothetical protein PGT21_027603 [Puccinia graminis f. sp. tritici]|uniref:Uncharacterized protein n=1 Tax=Puccinia graminis f. sp. tritici TaxID=56615 RepID=A0A5B0M5J5_PUCGR|nr:hypothetical protein PGTUg99_027836 [Puccinia graminis f. sp. tritici]KAA1072022.1 hypothetical protein PGT21_026065 [Puccinia graminis f. sp. tritici]KAA1078048.1 hypothetical protein PGT21_027603 [Puccinia graminis f. sp. tritici]
MQMGRSHGKPNLMTKEKAHMASMVPLGTVETTKKTGQPWLNACKTSFSFNNLFQPTQS